MNFSARLLSSMRNFSFPRRAYWQATQTVHMDGQHRLTQMRAFWIQTPLPPWIIGTPQEPCCALRNSSG